ncbi:MAG: ribokinase [Candidatus Brocadiia bacterium]|nr:MAG: ribokinase [Candidatus Brocadiia bacterium]
MTGRTSKVVVIGGTYIDMAIRCASIPAQGQSVQGSALSFSPAGPGPNQALEAALCGCDVHLISKIGGDPLGKLVIKSLHELKVNTEFVHVAEAKNTGMYVTLVNAKGGNAACIYTGANTALTPQDIEAADSIIREADVCLIDGNLPQEAVVAAIRLAKVHGIKVILDPAKPLGQPGITSDQLPIEYFSVDILIPNLEEAAYLAEQPDVNLRNVKLIGSDLVARGAKAAVITMGKRGSMIVDRENADHIPAFNIETVDQTGRGDAFAGALAAYCSVKDDLREAVKFASAAGALACTKLGSFEAMPKKNDIIQMLQKEDMDIEY